MALLHLCSRRMRGGSTRALTPGVASPPARLTRPSALVSLLRRPTAHGHRIGANTFFTGRGRAKAASAKAKPKSPRRNLPVAIATCGLVIWFLYPSEDFAKLRRPGAGRGSASSGLGPSGGEQTATAWSNFSTDFEFLSAVTDIEWSAYSDRLAGLILPEWAVLVPGYVRKLQAELSAAPGSLADEIWREAHDPFVNPEIRYSAAVRVSQDLCDEEKEFLARRRLVARVALARYLGLRERDVHPDDVPVIAMCGSGGGMRAVVAGLGSLLAAEEDGLFDCVTYTAGVSGSCWLQLLYHSTFARCRLARVLDHVKARASVHIAYPPEFFQALVMAPTNKYLLSGMVEKLRGDPKADFGLVDVYGLLLAARLMVPRGELAISDRDFKLSSQRANLQFGQNPLPIYTTVRHEIPGLEPDGRREGGGQAGEDAKALAKRESWFQWFELTPYEFFCEEFSAGIPTWALGRRFRDGVDVPPETGFHLPEVRVPLLMGIFGSAFCATLSHYYREVRPLVQSLTGFGAIDEMIWGRNEDLSKVHPIDPAAIPNFAFGMQGTLPPTTPDAVCRSEYVKLMDAGMSNNLPIYPLLRPGRNVEILVAFDASADIRTDNWLSVADGYARQRGIKGWPVGIGWPQPGETPAEMEQQLEDAQAGTPAEAEEKLETAQVDQAIRRMESSGPDDGKGSDSWQEAGGSSKFEPGDESAGDLGPCTIWVGSTQERTPSSLPPAAKALEFGDSSTTWHQLSDPAAGLALVYLPFLANDKCPDVHPGETEYLSTWNFVYTPAQVDSVVALARANYGEGKERIRGCVRAVYERKKKMREEREAEERRERYRRLMRRGMAHRLGEGDQFS